MKTSVPSHPRAPWRRGPALLLAVLSLLCLALAGVARAQTVYVLGSRSTFGSFNIRTLEYTEIQSSEDFGLNLSLAYDGTGGFYASQPGIDHHLVQVTTAGAVTQVATTPDVYEGLARAEGGTLYAYTDNRFGTVNPATGAFAEIGSTTYSPASGGGVLAFAGSKLYAVGENSDSSDPGLYAVNLATGSFGTRIGASNATYDSMVLFSVGSSLYGIHDDDVYLIDTSSGTLSLKGTLSGDDLPTSFYGAAATPSPRLSEVYTFDGKDGTAPLGGLLEAADGKFYGGTEDDGSSSVGTVFRFSAQSGSLQAVHTFSYQDNGVATPGGSLIQGCDGFLYGTAGNGGPSGYGGGVFRLSPDGQTYQLIHAFGGSEGGDDGVFPNAGLVQGNDGYLYGTTPETGNGENGVVFRVSTDGTFYQIIHAFDGTDGKSPHAGLIQSLDGYLYGTTYQGGANDKGTVFRLATDGGQFKAVHDFTGTDGSLPVGALVQASDGNLYGTTSYGGTNNKGTMFSLAPDGTGFQELLEFDGSGAQSPRAALVQANDGNLYGTTYAGGTDSRGTVFMVGLGGTAVTVLDSFSAEVGMYPTAPLIQAADGDLYSTSTEGGDGNDGGTIYREKLGGPEVMQFHQAINSAFQNAGTAMVRVDHVASSEAASVDYTTTNGAGAGGAKAGTDYTAAAGTLSWAAGDLKPKFVPVTILNRNLTDGSLRTLTITLSNVQSTDGTGEPALGNITTASLTINGSTPGVPAITSAATATATAGQPFSYQIEASASPRHYGVEGLPRGLTVNPDTGLISGTPNTTGTFDLTLHANNAKGKSTAPLTITTVLKAPVITSAKTLTVHLGSSFSYKITASGLPTRFGALGLRGDEKVNPDTGVINGTPTVVGTQTFTLQAINTAGTGMQTFTLTVDRIAPVITSARMASGTVGKAFTYQITANNAPGSFGVLGLPPGLKVDSTTGKITGTPTKAGTFTLTLKAVNSAGSDTKTLTLTVS